MISLEIAARPWQQLNGFRFLFFIYHRYINGKISPQK